MTNPYSARYSTSLKYFKEAVEEEFQGFDVSSKKSCILMFKNFHDFVEREVEDNVFLKNNSKNLVVCIKLIMSNDYEKGVKVQS
jgi:hypothetical protein